MEGRVVFYNAARGWGFLKPSGEKGNLFFHRSALSDGLRDLAGGTPVEFSEMMGPMGKLIATGIKKSVNIFFPRARES